MGGSLVPGRSRLRRVGVIVVVSFVVVMGIGAGAYYIAELQSSTTATESIAVSETASWESPMVPGETDSLDFRMENTESQRYVTKLVVLNYQDVEGETGLGAMAGGETDSNAYLRKISIDGWSGHLFDLLNDGEAYNYGIGPNGSKSVRVTLTVPSDAASGGSVNLTLGVKRASSDRSTSIIQQHPTTDGIACDSCHAVKKPVAVHEVNNVSSACANCHGRSMQDVHMDCTAACHQGYVRKEIAGGSYTIVEGTNDHTIGAGPYGQDDYSYDCGECHDKTPEVRLNEYTCGQEGQLSCHDGDSHTYHNWWSGESPHPGHSDRLGIAHRDGMGNFCGACHTAGQDVMSLHSTFSRSCTTCHGISAEGVHREYEDGDCSFCHGG